MPISIDEDFLMQMQDEICRLPPINEFLNNFNRLYSEIVCRATSAYFFTN